MSKPSWVERFWAKVDTSGDCWEWRASKRNGYGIFFIPGARSPQRAHRIAYELLASPIPEGMQLDHLCRNRSCVKPNHLEVVTPSENLHRSPIVQFAVNQNKTHCPHGHAYGTTNTRHYHGRRFCRACQAIARDRARGKI